MDVEEQEIKKRKPWLFEPCWRCGRIGKRYNWEAKEPIETGDVSPHYDSQAIMAVRCSDSSYSGTFHIPLCWSCASTLHNNLPEAYRIL